jgi:hypothetical protein
VYSKKEIASQKERIEKVRADPEKDEHDVRKQGEVLQEYEDGLQDELSRLLTAYEGLMGYMVCARARASEQSCCSYAHPA